MVVQRDLPVHVWGMAAPGENVSVTFRGETRSAIAGQLGRWSLYLRPGAAGGPFKMTVTTGLAAAARQAEAAAVPAITLDDVLVGDVWVASGHSNMEFEMRKAATATKDLPNANNPRIRLLVVKKHAIDYPLDDVDTDGWAASTPETAKDFSAVAWYFARQIEQREHVPVGVIDSSWGGTVADTWTRMAALGADAALAPVFVTTWGKAIRLSPERRIAGHNWCWQIFTRDHPDAEAGTDPKFLSIKFLMKDNEQNLPKGYVRDIEDLPPHMQKQYIPGKNEKADSCSRTSTDASMSSRKGI